MKAMAESPEHEAQEPTLDQLLREYARLNTQYEAQLAQMEADLNLKKLLDKRAELQRVMDKLDTAIETRRASFGIETLKEQKGTYRDMMKTWWNVDGKTFKNEVGTVTLRTTKSLVVLDKTAVVAFLTKNGKVEAAIKSFNTDLLRKYADVNLLPGVQYDERQSIVVKLTTGMKEHDR